MFDPHYWPSLYPGIFIGLAMGWSMGGLLSILIGGLGGLAGAALGLAVADFAAGLTGPLPDFASFTLMVVFSFAVAYAACRALPVLLRRDASDKEAR